MRRSVTTIVLIACALLALPAAALADGRAVIDDYDDNGQIDGCYAQEDFTEALDLIGENEQYGAAIDVIRQARVTNVEVPGEECVSATPATLDDISADGDDDDGGGISAWILGLIAVGVLAVGAGLWARMRGGSDA